VLNDARIQSHTITKLLNEKQTTKLVVASHATNIMLGANYWSIEPQNGPTPHEHAVRGLHAALGVVLPVLAHLFHTCNKELSPHQNCFALWITQSHFLGVNPTKISLACRYVMTSKCRWIYCLLAHHHHFRNSHHPRCLGVHPKTPQQNTHVCKSMPS